MKDPKILYASAATTADHNIDFNTSAKGGIFVIDVSADPAAASVVFTIQGVDSVSDSTWDILASAAVNAVGTRVLRVYPGLTAAANLTVSDVLPQAVRVNCNHTDADSITYSVGFIGID